jgi:ABC-2 type transport system permease protein
MLGSVFRETLRQARLAVLLWCAGLGLMAFVVTAIVPGLDVAKLMDVINSLPPFLVQAIGAGQDIRFATTPAGLVAVTFFNRFALIFAAYGLVMGLRVTADEEDEGIMDILVSLPLSRRRLVLEKIAAYGVTIFALMAAVLLGLALGAAASRIDLPPARVLASVANLLPMMAFMLAFTAFLGVAVRRRSTALDLGVVFIVASFLIDTIGGMAGGSWLGQMKVLSFFNYFDAVNVMKNGFSPGNAALLLALAALFATGAAEAFRRRDVDG